MKPAIATGVYYAGDPGVICGCSVCAASVFASLPTEGKYRASGKRVGKKYGYCCQFFDQN